MRKTQFSWALNVTAVLLIGVALRLFLAFVSPLNHDTDIWLHVSEDWTLGRSPYAGECLYIYAPPWLFVMTLTSYLAQAAHFPFAIAVKFPLILVDMLIFFTLIAGCLRLGLTQAESLRRAALFFLNPISLMTTGVHGQFDNLSLLFLALAWFAFTFKKNQSLFWGCVYLSVSVAAKHFTAMMAFVFAFMRKKWSEKLLVVVSAPALFIASFLPYWKDFDNINRVILHYNLHGGYWGWSGIICRGVLFFTGYDLIQQPFFHAIDYFNSFLYIGIIVASWFLVKHYSLLDCLILVFLIFYSLTTQIGVQYTLWVLPFAAMARPDRYFWAYTLTGAVQLAAFYYCHYHWWREIPIQGMLQNLIPETYVLFRYLTWVVCVFWLTHLLRDSRRHAF